MAYWSFFAVAPFAALIALNSGKPFAFAESNSEPSGILFRNPRLERRLSNSYANDWNWPAAANLDDYGIGTADDASPATRTNPKRILVTLESGHSYVLR